MSKTSLVLAAAVLFGLTSAAVPRAAETGATAAEANMQVLLETLRANRKALIAVNLNLTDQQAAQFWPLYERYQQATSAVGDRVLAIIDDYQKNFRDLANDKALDLVRDYLAAEAERVKVRQSFVDEFAKILPGRTVARFYQIENKIDAVLRYDLAATIPVVDAEGAAPAK